MSGAALDRFETVAFVYSPSNLALLLSLFESKDIFVVEGREELPPSSACGAPAGRPRRPIRDFG